MPSSDQKSLLLFSKRQNQILSKARIQSRFQTSSVKSCPDVHSEMWRPRLQPGHARLLNRAAKSPLAYSASYVADPPDRDAHRRARGCAALLNHESQKDIVYYKLHCDCRLQRYGASWPHYSNGEVAVSLQSLRVGSYESCCRRMALHAAHVLLSLQAVFLRMWFNVMQPTSLIRLLQTFTQ